MGLFDKSSNPVMNEETFRSDAVVYTEKMTLNGTIQKTGILLLITIAFGIFSWNQFFSGANIMFYLIGGVFGGLILALVISFKPHLAKYLAPIYAVFEGLFLGAFSGYASTLMAVSENGLATANATLPLQAVGLTMLTFVIMLGLYRFRIIKVTQKFKSIIMGVTLAVGLYYLIGFVLSLFTGFTFFHSMSNSSLPSILFSVFVVALASLNLLLDFDLIENGIKGNAPKHMEWFGGFALLVTLVWLYYEILRLLVKLASRD
ncbi:MAG: hypothetical protein CSA38_00955 [Flavobacteriales bacterium]|nr:MAG: hypothetical protein CSA38_00955 [Flavobacteriales bacterium]